jgi:hypothetical protein
LEYFIHIWFAQNILKSTFMLVHKVTHRIINKIIMNIFQYMMLSLKIQEKIIFKGSAE